MQRVISSLHVPFHQISHAYQLWRLLLLAKLHAGRSPIAPELYYGRAIKTQRFHGGTACRRQSNEMRSIGAPRKMVRQTSCWGWNSVTARPETGSGAERRLALWRLHVGQLKHRLSSWVRPPALRGMMWSTSNATPIICSGLRQYAYRPCAASRTVWRSAWGIRAMPQALSRLRV